MQIDPRSDALIVVDLQPDFMPGGALPVPDGDRVAAPIGRLARRWRSHRKVTLMLLLVNLLWLLPWALLAAQLPRYALAALVAALAPLAVFALASGAGRAESVCSERQNQA